MSQFYLCSEIGCNRKYKTIPKYKSHLLNDHNIVVENDLNLVTITKDNKNVVEHQRNANKKAELEQQKINDIRKQQELEQQARQQFEEQNRQRIIELEEKYLQIRERIDDNPNLCSICFDKPVDACCNPCGHLNFCNGCITDWCTMQGNCPICRTKINSVLKVHIC